jgi:branched-chain amino acid transport system substrate-binding protein
MTKIKEGKNSFSRRRFLQAAAGSAAAVKGLNVMPALAQSSAPIKLGVIAPISGPYAAQGLAGAQGIRLLAETVNARGGLLGRQIEVLLEDSQLKPQTAVVKATKLIKQDKVDFLLGEISGASTLAMNELTNREKILLLSPYTSVEAITGSGGSRYQFRTFSNTYIQAAVAAHYMTANVGKRWGVMAADYAYGQEYVQHLRTLVPKFGGEIVNVSMPSLGTTDFSSYLERASSGSPDVLWMVEYGRDATVAFNQAASMGLKKKMAFGLSAANSEQVEGMQPGVFEDTFAFMTWYPNWDGPGSQDFVKAYHAKYKEYSESAGTHYLGAQVLIGAIERAGTTETEAVIKTLEDGTFDTIKGKIRMRAYDHQAVQRYCMGKGTAARSTVPYPYYEAMKWYEVDDVEKNFMLPPDPKVHPVRWRA